MGAVGAVTHGGVTMDLHRTLLGDDALPDGLMAHGVPSCGITTLAGLWVLVVDRIDHLSRPCGTRCAPGRVESAHQRGVGD
jgi:hypothetical protein